MNERRLSESPTEGQQSTCSFTQSQKNGSSKQERSQHTLFSKDNKRIAHTSTQGRNQPGNHSMIRSEFWKLLTEDILAT